MRLSLGDDQIEGCYGAPVAHGVVRSRSSDLVDRRSRDAATDSDAHSNDALSFARFRRRRRGRPRDSRSGARVPRRRASVDHGPVCAVRALISFFESPLRSYTRIQGVLRATVSIECVGRKHATWTVRRSFRRETATRARTRGDDVRRPSAGAREDVRVRWRVLWDVFRDDVREGVLWAR